MSNADRIEELRDKYEENPRRYFAPLANEYRKAGDLAQAIAICREHLPKQPGHMSGYIVFGQTLFEANSLEEARSVFEQALTLDPENLIALKHLGDIARMNGANGIARRWYARVLDADPRNDDIASQLASLGAPTPVVPLAAVPAPAPYSPPPIEEAVGVFATFDPASLLDVPDDAAAKVDAHEFWSPTKAQPVTQHEPLDLDFPENPEPEAQAGFEEGILAPEWPDTTELVARIVTPLRSTTPISVPVTPDAVEAFGREASDALESAPVDLAPQDELVEAFLPPDATHATHVVEDALDIEAIDHNVDSFEAEPTDHEVGSFDIEASTDEVEPLVDAFSEPLSVAVDEPSAASESAEDDSIEFDSFENAVLTSSDETPSAVSQLFELPLIDAPTATAPALMEWSEPESVPHSEIEDFAFAAELPWEPETGVEPESPAEVEAVAADIAVTAEFPVPTQLTSSAYAAFGTDAVFDDALADAGFDETPDSPDEESAGLFEESFAEISSELQNERDAADREAFDRDASVRDTVAVESEAVAEVVSAQVGSSESESARPFVTETMAELLVSQGFHARAIEVYVELVHRRPHDPVLVSRLAELRAFGLPEVAHPETAASTFTPRFSAPPRSTPMYNTPLYSTPLYTTPLSATPVLVASLGESASTQSNLSERHAADRLHAFRTARERFAELARRRVARRTPTHATAVADDASEGLSSLFGTALPATTDELAARALADAFGPVQDSGESFFDPTPTPTPAMPMRSLTPRANTIIQPAQAAESRRDRQPSADYSFDKFFPDPAMAAREAQFTPTTVAPSPSSAQPVNEDLAQFSAWLKGLNNA